MAQESDHRDDGTGAPQPFFSGGEGDPTASCGSQGLDPGAQIEQYKLPGILGKGGYENKVDTNTLDALGAPIDL